MSHYDINKMSPETLMLGLGYNPWWSEGSVKAPMYLTSTFVFKTAEDGEEFFKRALGLSESKEAPGLIYSRLNNPQLEILENRLAVWEKAEDAAVFASGMAAIASTVMSLCKPGDLVVYTVPIYGGTSHLFTEVLPHYGIRSMAVNADDNIEDVLSKIDDPALRMFFIETPSNPTCTMTDIAAVAKIRDTLAKKYNKEIVLAIDNTLLGPVFQKPLLLGADVSCYSATKFIAGHSDLIAGAVISNKKYMKEIKHFRAFVGTMASPFSSWLMLRSLETLKIRMEAQQRNAEKVAAFLVKHPKVSKVYYPGLFETGTKQQKISASQTTGYGSLISFEVKGGKAPAFKLLNSVHLCHLAVSLGGTETLIQHPKTMTHSEIAPDIQERVGITDGLVRISLGVENADDIIADLKQAME